VKPTSPFAGIETDVPGTMLGGDHPVGGGALILKVPNTPLLLRVVLNENVLPGVVVIVPD
jgi:hypothetical protein